MSAVLFVAAAAVGTLTRWRLGHGPIGTVALNVVGSFGLGLVAQSGPDADLLVGVAGLGALTTFSRAIADLFDLAEVNRRTATAYGLGTLVLGVAAAWLGLRLR